MITIARQLPRPKILATSEKLNEPIYYIAFFIYFIQIIINCTTYTKILFINTEILVSIAKVVVFLLLFIKFIIQQTSLVSTAISLAAALIGFASWRQSGEGWLFWTILFVISASGIRIRPLAKITLLLSLLTLALTVPIAKFGLIENKTFIRDGAVRYAMGFTHPNGLGRFLLSSCIAFSVLRFGKNPVPDLIFISIAVLLNLTLVDSRTAVVLCLTQAILLLIFHYARNEKSRVIFRYIFMAITIFAIMGSLFYMIAYNPNNAMDNILNKMLSDRLKLANAYFKMKPLTPFGCDYENFAPIYWSNGEPVTFLVDNAWCHLYLRYGIFTTALFLTGFITLLKKKLQQGDWDALLFGLILITVYGLSEAFSINIEFNFFLYAIGADVLYSSKLARKDSHHTCAPVPHVEINSILEYILNEINLK